MTLEKKVIINTASVRTGGGVQAAVGFLRHLVNARSSQSSINWFLLLSPQVHQGLKSFSDDSLNKLAYRIIKQAPARSKKAREEISSSVSEGQYDLVFTFMGPAYVNFKTTHLMGVADGWSTHSDRIAYSTIAGLKSKISLRLLCFYKQHWFKKADYWFVEADCAKRGMIDKLHLPANRISVIPNSCAPHYLNTEATEALLPDSGKFRFLSFSAYYPHKNLEIIPAVLSELKDRGISEKFEFVLTLDPASSTTKSILKEAAVRGVQNSINNIGPVALTNGPALYRSVDALFMPSVFETFSVSHLEAMAMKKSIVTANRSFTADVCKDAALYFEPMDPKSAAGAIVELWQNPSLAEKLVQKGVERLKDFPTSEKKNELLLQFIKEIIGK